ncbi:MAG: TolB family protein [Planctomycetota bacterium]|jgi:hypothetical protein
MVILLICFFAVVIQLGCQTTTSTTDDEIWLAAEQHKRSFGDFELPHKVGSVENVGVQIPSISPTGKQILYLRTDHHYISPMTLFGSPAEQDTPPQATCSIWIRPLNGTSAGQRLSSQRWAHSPVWSDSGRCIAYVVNEPPNSFIVHMDLTGGVQTKLGLNNAINCLPRFDGDDRTLLFCAGTKPEGHFRVHRQVVGESQPQALTPNGPDCIFPLASSGNGKVLCACVQADHLNWVMANSNGINNISKQCGTAQRPTILQTWAGITKPLSPDRKNFIFYDSILDRISVFHVTDQRLRRHRPRSIAACWIDNDTIALAIPDGVFIVNASTGVSINMMNGSWIPCRFLPRERKLILLGRETNRQRHFSIWEVVFKTR